MRRLFQAAVLLAAVACSDNSTSPTVSLTGTYSLMMVNGQSLPYQFPTGSSDVVQLNNDVLTLNSNGTYTDVSQWTSSRTGNFTVTELGTYTATNGAITFFDQTDNTTYSGSLSGAVLTEISSDGLTQVYQKT